MKLNIKNWVKRVNKEIRNISEHKTEDRLDAVEAIYKCHLLMHNSLTVWKVWLENPGITSTFTVEELNEIHDKFRELAVMFLKNDIKWTILLSSRFDISESEDLRDFVERYADEEMGSSDKEHSTYIR